MQKNLRVWEKVKFGIEDRDSPFKYEPYTDLA